MKIKKICTQCGKEFEVLDKQNYRDRKTCSEKCRRELVGYKISLKTPKIKVFCLTCGKEFIVTEARIKAGRGKYCSRRCQGKQSTWLKPFPKGGVSWNKGKKASLETRKKQSIAKKNFIKAHPEYLENLQKMGRIILSSPIVQAKAHSKESMKKVGKANKINTQRFFQNPKNRKKQSEKIKKSWTKSECIYNYFRGRQLFRGIPEPQLTDLDKEIIRARVRLFKTRREENNEI